ncbi:hypothetical protein XELAEV_18010041mg [Xenopus laevis]|uniref:Secreted protein n=1 Tax=Xenopus laevis TaxID=8355 RepID=A0A974DUN1_XENLA|nr:hypothetical protein XELAEV_18010041mg [Xenopus laevis]
MLLFCLFALIYASVEENNMLLNDCNVQRMIFCTSQVCANKGNHWCYNLLFKKHTLLLCYNHIPSPPIFTALYSAPAPRHLGRCTCVVDCYEVQVTCVGFALKAPRLQ